MKDFDGIKMHGATIKKKMRNFVTVIFFLFFKFENTAKPLCAF
jgi:hypothetical protein